VGLHRAPPARDLRGRGGRAPAVKVFIPTPLRSYTGDRSEVEASGATIAEVLADLDRRYPGIRFRMIDEQDAVRRHIRIWVNKDEARALDVPVRPTDEVIIFQALSGG
jgi:sulfur-carrier protein